eukprot:evm.model.scf_194.2 EVM.evm.TU.scf_194.2   scf_194:11876-18216(-)
MEVDPPASNFDVEAYISNYQSHTKVDRLLFIAKKLAGAEQELEALRMAIDELKKAADANRYMEAVKQVDGRLGPEYELDSAWVERTSQQAVSHQEELEQNLHTYKTNLIKESIRMGYKDLGNFYYEHGMLQESFKHFLKTRDYATTPKHHMEMYLSAMKVALEMKNYIHMHNYLRKAEQIPEVQKDKDVNAKVNCMGGLLQLESTKYKLAARKFVEVDAELGSKYCEVIAPQDVAIYGGLCALASFDRRELKSKVVDNINFREFLELVPEMRDCIYDFYKSRYASCLATLSRLKPSLVLDIHLHSHVEGLYQAIRQKALIQYTIPFMSVDLHPMAEAFSVSVSELEKELVSLIMEKRIQARIDSHRKVLYAQHANERVTTFQNALSTSEHYIRETKNLLLRASLMKHELIQYYKYGKRHGHHGPGPTAPMGP